MDGEIILKEIIVFMMKLVGGHFWNFVKRLVIAIPFFVIPYVASCYVSMLIYYGINFFGVNSSVSITICRILLTVAPAVPTSIYAICKEEDRSEGFNMDFCFIAWISTIFYAWNIL